MHLYIFLLGFLEDRSSPVQALPSPNNLTAQPCIISKTPCLLLTVQLLGCHAMPIDASTCSQAPCMLREPAAMPCDAIDPASGSRWIDVQCSGGPVRGGFAAAATFYAANHLQFPA